MTVDVILKVLVFPFSIKTSSNELHIFEMLCITNGFLFLLLVCRAIIVHGRIMNTTNKCYRFCFVFSCFYFHFRTREIVILEFCLSGMVHLIGMNGI